MVEMRVEREEKGSTKRQEGTAQGNKKREGGLEGVGS